MPRDLERIDRSREEASVKGAWSNQHEIVRLQLRASDDDDVSCAARQPAFKGEEHDGRVRQIHAIVVRLHLPVYELAPGQANQGCKARARQRGNPQS